MPDHEVLVDLLRAAGEGDDRAMRAFVELTSGLVTRVCRTLGDANDLDDLVQETYLRAMRAAPGFRADAPVEAWLVTIARRVCADDVRRRQRRRRLATRLSAIAPRADDTSDLFDADDGGLAAMVSRLEPERREAFVLTSLIGLSYDEAAAVMGCPVGTIRSRVARARADLQQQVMAHRQRVRRA